MHHSTVVRRRRSTVVSTSELPNILDRPTVIGIKTNSRSKSRQAYCRRKKYVDHKNCRYERGANDHGAHVYGVHNRKRTTDLLGKRQSYSWIWPRKFWANGNKKKGGGHFSRGSPFNGQGGNDQILWNSWFYISCPVIYRGCLLLTLSCNNEFKGE